MDSRLRGNDGKGRAIANRSTLKVAKDHEQRDFIASQNC